mmetsp:Transcript_97451/g.275662  ORF Transcript_97451/g.275662 Transcript_97451/m.275662 type:complete len:258 (+) Transcript_97451:594-1367(+)
MPGSSRHNCERKQWYRLIGRFTMAAMAASRRSPELCGLYSHPSKLLGDNSVRRGDVPSCRAEGADGKALRRPPELRAAALPLDAKGVLPLVSWVHATRSRVFICCLRRRISRMSSFACRSVSVVEGVSGAFAIPAASANREDAHASSGRSLRADRAESAGSACAGLMPGDPKLLRQLGEDSAWPRLNVGTGLGPAPWLSAGASRKSPCLLPPPSVLPRSMDRYARLLVEGALLLKPVTVGGVCACSRLLGRPAPQCC